MSSRKEKEVEIEQMNDVGIEERPGELSDVLSPTFDDRADHQA